MQEAISLWPRGDIYYNGIIGYKLFQTFFKVDGNLFTQKLAYQIEFCKLATEVFGGLGGAVWGMQ